jgi:hypothetical protein
MFKHTKYFSLGPQKRKKSYLTDKVSISKKDFIKKVSKKMVH